MVEHVHGQDRAQRPVGDREPLDVCRHGSFDTRQDAGRDVHGEHGQVRPVGAYPLHELSVAAAHVRYCSAYAGQLAHDDAGEVVSWGLPLVEGLAGCEVLAVAVRLVESRRRSVTEGSFAGWVVIAAPWVC